MAVVGAGEVVEVDEEVGAVVDVGGGMVGCWRRVVVDGSGVNVLGVWSSVLLVVRGTVVAGGAVAGTGAGATGT